MRTGSRSSWFTVALGVVAALPAGAVAARAQDSSSHPSSCDTCVVPGFPDVQHTVDQLRRELDRTRRVYDSVMSPRARRDMERALARLNESVAARFNEESVAARPAGWLGITVSSGSYELQSANGEETMRFADYPTIETVEPDSPAERAGIEARDRLIALAGRDVTRGTIPFSRLLKPGSHLAVRVKRGRSTKDLTVLIGKRPEHDWPAWNSSFRTAPASPRAPRAPRAPDAPGNVVVVAPLPPMPSVAMMEPSHVTVELRGPESATIAGARVQRMVGDLRDYFGVRDGLLVLDVVRGTPAQRAGLRGGDVIVRADGRNITSPLSLARAMERANDNEMRLDVVRKKKTTTVRLRWDQ